MRSNLACWQELQATGYFDSPTYKDRPDFGDFEIRAIEHFTPLRPDMVVAIIGCGYGRETEHIAPRVRHVYGIDVSESLLEAAQRNLHEKGITNFTPVLAADYATKIPAGLDLVFSIVVMQHLTRDLVVDYFWRLGRLLSPAGKMIVQFAEEIGKDPRNDAELQVYEPMVNWTSQQILTLSRLAGLNLEEIRTLLINEGALWHWAYVSKGAAMPGAGVSSLPPIWPGETTVATAGPKSIRAMLAKLAGRAPGRG